MISNNRMVTDPEIAIFEIERFSVHDGPGIRTVIFFQGCPLRCMWCSNPESQRKGIFLRYIERRCAGCGNCFNACPNNAIQWKENKPVFNRELCKSCKICSASCLSDAIQFSGEQMSVSSIMHIVLRDMDYYRTSGGGVTFSGGEAFMQPKGLMNLLMKCHSENLHTAVETCGQVPMEQLLKALPLVDLFLFDIKHIDKKKLKYYTGADICLIIKNLKCIAMRSPEKIIIRIPVIPGFNYDTATIRSIFDLAVETGVKTIHLLPYHTLGIDKYRQMGIDYPYSHTVFITKEELLPYKQLGEEMGLVVQIGG